MTNKRGKSIKLNLRLVFILVGAGILLFAASAVLFTLYLLIDRGVIQLEDIRGGGVWIIILFVLASVVIGTIGTAIFGKLFSAISTASSAGFPRFRKATIRCA